jgi:hypothetical protein
VDRVGGVEAGTVELEARGMHRVDLEEPDFAGGAKGGGPPAALAARDAKRFGEVALRPAGGP